jgi:hypothetical protein
MTCRSGEVFVLAARPMSILGRAEKGYWWQL